MNESMLEVLTYQGQGYQPLIDYGEWRVALLRYLDALQPDQIDSMERHTGTDEVFVLLNGRGVLILGGNGAQVDRVVAQVMEPEKIYNVKRNTWHTILISRDAAVLLVENNDVSPLNSEYAKLFPLQRGLILETARREHIGQFPSE